MRSEQRTSGFLAFGCIHVSRCRSDGYYDVEETAGVGEKISPGRRMRKLDERVSTGKGKEQKDEFLRKNERWTSERVNKLHDNSTELSVNIIKI